MKIAICDDDKSFLKDFSERIRKYSSVSIVDCFSDYENLEAELMDDEYDVIMMDIDWDSSQKNGIDISKKLYESHKSSMIVYVSSYAEKYIEETYLKKTNAVAFLVKPVKTESLNNCISQLEKLLHADEEEFLYISEKGSKIKISLSSIVYAESKDHYIDLVTLDDEYHIPGKLSDLENKLQGLMIRCHRSFLINLNHIYKYSANQIIVKKHVSIPIGRKYSEEFKEKYVSYLADKI